jgi:F-type H+-transporting ATPase subunit b
MSSTLQALVDLLIRSVPTIIFFIVLTYYLKYMFFRPLQKVLDERRKATEGVRGLASEANEAADRQLSEFEQALKRARNEIYKYNDDLRRQWNEEQLVLLDQARAEAAEKLKAAKQLINEELEQAEAELSASIEPLSEEIVQTLLRRRAA